MILEYLSPSDLVRFFCTSKWALSHANLLCRSNPLHFYRCRVGACKDQRILMIALSSWSCYSELDTRWQIVREAAELARLLPSTEQNDTVPQTFDPGAPLRPINHQSGLHESLLNIPPDAKTITVCSVQLRGQHYVRGIEIDTGQSSLFVGRKTKSLHTMNIPSATTETIGLAMDSLGVRSINYATCQWSSGDPSSIGCWEGLSVRRAKRKIRVIHDVTNRSFFFFFFFSAVSLTKATGAQVSILGLE